MPPQLTRIHNLTSTCSYALCRMIHNESLRLTTTFDHVIPELMMPVTGFEPATTDSEIFSASTLTQKNARRNAAKKFRHNYRIRKSNLPLPSAAVPKRHMKSVAKLNA